ncbi:MAG TPA: amidohydrolase [Thermoanaerobaculia bacterium]|nr:amidohydrolase [Thermoanaerobaculia bacterium]
MPRTPIALCLTLALGALPLAATAAAPPSAGAGDRLGAEIDRLAAQAEPDVIACRRQIHEHPELSNREVETAKLVAERLGKLGLEVKTGVAHTGVVAMLKGGKPGPLVALRADMDALPVTEEVDVPFASKVRTTYDGKEVGVMHACGHDAHTAILLGVAGVLAKLKADLPGNVEFLFQPAEEGAPAGEEGGAKLMLKEGIFQGVFQEKRPAAVFGLHVTPMFDTGQIGWRTGGMLAGADGLRITVHGRQTHAAYPWKGVDPIVVAAQIVLGLQTIASRQIDITDAPALITIGKIDGGVRENIIPDDVVMQGTIRYLGPEMRKDIHDRIRRTAMSIAESAGAKAEVTIEERVALTFNDPALTAKMLPSLRRTAGDANVREAPPSLGGEDFSYYQREVPGLFIWLGIKTPGADPALFATNHSPRFRIDESGLKLGVRALARLAVDYMQAPAQAAAQGAKPAR